MGRRDRRGPRLLSASQDHLGEKRASHDRNGMSSQNTKQHSGRVESLQQGKMQQILVGMFWAER